MVGKDGLTDKQRRFCEEYLVDLNATQAAIRAGYKEKNAYIIGHENLRKPKISEYLSREREELSQKTKVTQERIIDELASIAFAKITDYAKIIDKPIQITKNGTIELLRDESGKVINVQDIEFTLTDKLTDEQKRSISSLKRTRSGIELRTHNKLEALKLLGEYLGMFEKDDNEKGVSVTIINDIPDVKE